MNRRIVLAGGSGFLGQALADHFTSAQDEVNVLTRAPQSYRGSGHADHWDGKNLGAWAELLDGATAVINLTGKSVNCRHTPANRQEIIASRIDSVRAITQAILLAKQPPRVWLQAGSLAIYGDAQERVCTEDAPYGDDFSVDVCKQWEQAFNETALPQTRQVLLRIGFVLGESGGALATLANLTRWLLGGTVGNGQQYISWLHIEDFNRMCEWALENDFAVGVYNATGPTPVTNAEFMRTLRRVLQRPWSPPAPEWAVRIGARLMGTEADLALTGRHCLPQKLLDQGFSFNHTDLRSALAQLLA